MNIIKPVYAQITNPALPKQNVTVENSTSFIQSFLQVAITMMMIIGVIYFVWHFVMGAFHFISSEGEDKKISEAKLEITWAVVGLAIVFAVFAVLRIIGTVFGVNLIDIKIPTL